MGSKNILYTKLRAAFIKNIIRIISKVVFLTFISIYFKTLKH